MPYVRQFYRMYGNFGIESAQTGTSEAAGRSTFNTKIAEHTGKNEPFPNVSVWTTVRQFLDAKHSYSAETGKSCFGESLV